MFRNSPRRPKPRPQRQTVMTVEEYRALVERSMLEEDWMQQVIEYGRIKGWRHYHTYDARHAVEGYPDLTLVRGHRLVFIECKREREKPTIEQWNWACDLQAAGGEVYLYHPHDVEDMEAVLA